MLKLFQQSLRRATTISREPGLVQLDQFNNHPNFYRIISGGLNRAIAMTSSAQQIKACEQLFIHPKGCEAFKNMGPVNEWLTGSPESIQLKINTALGLSVNVNTRDSFAEAIKDAGNAIERSLKF